MASNDRSSAVRGGDRREDVVDVGPADQPRLDADRAARRPHVERQPLERKRQRAGRDVGRAIDGVGHRPAADLGQRQPARIVDIDQARRVARQHLEQPALRLEVVLHVGMEVEMVARQVREDARRERHRRRRGGATARATTLPSRRRGSRRRPSRAASPAARALPASCASRRAARIRCGSRPCRAGRSAGWPRRRWTPPDTPLSSCRSCPVMPTTCISRARMAVERRRQHGERPARVVDHRPDDLRVRRRRLF